MSRRIKVNAILIALCIVFCGVNAEQFTVPGKADSRIRSVHYNPNNVTELPIAPVTTLLIKFSSSESIVKYSSGATTDPGNNNQKIYQVTRVPSAPNLLFVKAGRFNVPTNLTVVTNGSGELRTYQFWIDSKPNTKPILQLNIIYRDDIPNSKKRMTGKAIHNEDYLYAGDGVITPTKVWDDGTFTYFTFAPNQPIPVIYVVTDDMGHTRLPTQNQNGRTVVVQAVSRQFALWEGSNEVDVIPMNYQYSTG